MIRCPEPQRSLTVGKLATRVYATREEMGAAAACDVARRMRELFGRQERIRMVFAAAPSQNEFLDCLGTESDLDWDRVVAFHMDEYVGLDKAAPQRFGNFLRSRLFGYVRPGRVEYIEGHLGDIRTECARYSALLNDEPLDIVCAGIGENGHMAFNDPPVADFRDSETVKLVSLDETCRMQQVHDGAFADIDAVPRTAMTMTMPALMSAHYVYCIVPGRTKTKAVRRTLRNPIATNCPATIMRRHPKATLYLDTEAAAKI